MSTVAVVVVVVGSCIGVVVSFVTRWLEDATDSASPERARHAARPRDERADAEEAWPEEWVDDDPGVDDPGVDDGLDLDGPDVDGPGDDEITDDEIDRAEPDDEPGAGEHDTDLDSLPVAPEPVVSGGVGRRPTVRERRLAMAAEAARTAAAPATASAPPADGGASVVDERRGEPPARVRRRKGKDAGPVVVVEPAPLPAGAVVSERIVAGPVAQRVTPVRWWERFRSAMALTVVSVVLGILAAAAVGVALVALFSVLRSAVG